MGRKTEPTYSSGFANFWKNQDTSATHRTPTPRPQPATANGELAHRCVGSREPSMAVATAVARVGSQHPSEMMP